jgi:hypothetical protein
MVVAGIRRATGSGIRGWLDRGNKSRDDTHQRLWLMPRRNVEGTTSFTELARLASQ